MPFHCVISSCFEHRQTSERPLTFCVLRESVAADFWVTWQTRSERLGVTVLPCSFPHHSSRRALNKDYRWTPSTWLSPMPNAKWRSFSECAALLLNGDTSDWEHILLNIVSGCVFRRTICAQVCRGENSRRRNERQVSLSELVLVRCSCASVFLSVFVLNRNALCCLAFTNYHEEEYLCIIAFTWIWIFIFALNSFFLF